MIETAIKLKPLSSISPSRYYNLLQCRMREVFLSSGLSPLLPVSPVARIGTVIHSFFESVIKESKGTSPELESAWVLCERKVEDAMRNLWTESHLVPLRDSVPGYEVKKRMAFRIARRLFAASTGLMRPFRLCEVWYQSRDGLVRGKVDCVITLPDGGVILEDYKTGPVTGQGDNGREHVKPEYSIQMKLYASLFWATTGTWPVGLRVVGLDGTAYEVDFTPQECVRLLDSARKVLVETNSLIKHARSQLAIINILATPGPGTCRPCLYRPACTPYWEKYNKEGDPDGWPYDVQGTIIEVRKLGNGRTLLIVKPKEYMGGEAVFIRDIQVERHVAINQGAREVALYNLVKEGDRHYKEGALTTCYPASPFMYGEWKRG